MSQHVTALEWLAQRWLWIVFWGWILGVFSFIGSMLKQIGWLISVSAQWVAEIPERRHQRRMRELRLQAKIAQKLSSLREREQARPDNNRPDPEECIHPRHRVVQVLDSLQSLVAWYCEKCDTQLDVDWANRKEDL